MRWCMRIENPPSKAETSRVVPTNDKADDLLPAVSKGPKRKNGALGEYGAGMVREESHMPAKCRRQMIAKDTLFED